MRAPVIAVLAFVVSGCATQDEPPTASALMSVPDEEQLTVCTREKPTGSNRLVKVCRPVADEIDRENTRRDMKVLQRQSEIVGGPN